MIYNISVTTRLSEYSGNPVFEVTYDYGATNSFGGMVRDTITGTYSGKEAAPYYEGKKIDYSHVNLNDLAKMDKYYDWEKSKMWGDYELYLYNRRNQVEGNIWSD